MPPAFAMLLIFIAPIGNPADKTKSCFLPQSFLMPRTLEMLCPFIAPIIASLAIFTKHDFVNLVRFHR